MYQRNDWKHWWKKYSKKDLNLVKGNSDITMTEMEKVHSDINGLKASLERTETTLKEQVTIEEKKIEKLQEQINEIWDYQVDS